MSPKNELERIEHRCDQSASMHGALAEHYETWSRILNLGCLAFSVSLLAFALAQPAFFERVFCIRQDIYSLIMAGLGALTTVASVVAAVWKPEDLAAQHRQALRHYVQCKYAARDKLGSSAEPSSADLASVRVEYLDDHWLPMIPDSKFCALKRRHLLKVAVSKYLDDNPTVPIWLVRWRLWKGYNHKTPGEKQQPEA